MRRVAHSRSAWASAGRTSPPQRPRRDISIWIPRYDGQSNFRYSWPLSSININNFNLLLYLLLFLSAATRGMLQPSSKERTCTSCLCNLLRGHPFPRSDKGHPSSYPAMPLRTLSRLKRDDFPDKKRLRVPPKQRFHLSSVPRRLDWKRMEATRVSLRRFSG